MTASRWLPRAGFLVSAAFAVSLAIIVLTPGPGRAADGMRVVSSIGNRLVFEVRAEDYRIEPSAVLPGTERLVIPGFGTVSEIGEPRVPARRFLVALPPEGTFTLRYTVLKSEALGRHRLEPVPFPISVRDGANFVSTSEEYRIDEARYRARRFVAGVSSAGEGQMRHQRVLFVRVAPVSYDPVTGEASIATSIRVELTFSGARNAADRAGTRAVRESAAWETLLSRSLVNPARAREWRIPPRAESLGSGINARTAEVIAGPLVKLRVTSSQLYRVSAASAIASGFPSGTPTSDLHLFQRSYDEVTFSEQIVDVAYRVVEDAAGTAGTFDGADYVVFFGQALRDDALRGDPIQKFADQNLYWLGASAGPQMAPKVIAPGFVSADTAQATFHVVRHFESDLFFMEETPPGLVDFYYYSNPFASTFSAPFSLDAVKSSGTYTVKAEFLGSNRDRALRAVDIKILNVNGTAVLNRAFVPRDSRVVYTSPAMPASQLVEGLNTLRIEPDPSNEVSVLEALLNWFDVEYDSPYRARGNVLDFHSGTLAGDTSISVTGLGRDDVLLFDVTDPVRPQACQLTPAHFTSAGGGFVLSFRETFSTQRHYIAAPLDKINEIAGGDVIADVPSGLIGSPAEAGVDVLVVTAKDFIDEAQRWVSYRRAQGYGVLMADIDEIYDEFNGGVPHARAVRRFVRHFFEKGNASFLLLIGDSSEDNKRVHVESGVNYVPTESFTEFVGAGFNENEVVTTDKYYVMLGHDFIKSPSLIVADFMPSLIVGRLSVGSVTELQRVIDKILLFEKPKADDFWRRRMIRVADDAWSFSTANTCYQPVEQGFERGEEAGAVITENAIPGGFDVVRFYLSDRIAHPDQGICVFRSVQQNRCRMNAVPALIAELNKGATMVSFQTHMNRFQMCHEFLFTSSTETGEQRDHLRLTNEGRPFIAFAMGCHLSDYALHKEKIRQLRNGINGDCLSELLLFLENGKGAVSTYGSTGFEYLSTNEDYTATIARAFFETPPVDTMVASSRAQARWILGEMMTLSEVRNLSSMGVFGPGNGAVGMIKRYHLLGDPLLRIDAGPPRFEVTADGQPIESGTQLFSGSGGDSIAIRAVLTDEVAIEKITLEIAGQDASDQLTITPLVDQSLSAARQYEVTFKHKVLPSTYQIKLRAHQAVDTTGTGFHMVGEFILNVQLNAVLKVDGRPITNGDVVPSKADYLFELTSPVVVDPGLIRAEIDSAAVPQIDIAQPNAGDSTTWFIGFSADLSEGRHTVSIFVGNAEFPFQVVVSVRNGIRDVIAYPNPFRDDTYFVYTNEAPITGGSIEVFTTGGKRVIRLDIPPSARRAGQNAVQWNGRTFSGDEIANGVYLYVIRIDQGGHQTIHRGKLAHVK